ncbi:hypothetical protein B0H11DRAFT_2018997 [Mycena galericulata]|nr:hypothetical protein B0H11DRAFT_2018997 [Mycena galericulata]
MKSFQNIVAAAFALATFSSANAAAVAGETTTTGAVTTVIGTTRTGGITITATTRPETTVTRATSRPAETTVTASGSVSEITSTEPVPSSSIGVASTITATTVQPTGGFVVTGIYTTCLTVTFDAANPTGTATATGTTIPSSSAPAEFTTLPTATANATEAAPSSAITIVSPSGSSFLPPVAVFTTCLAFLPTESPVLSTIGVSSSSIAVSTLPIESFSTFSEAGATGTATAVGSASSFTTLPAATSSSFA